MVWSGTEKEISPWYKGNKVYDVITDDEIEEIWKKRNPDDEPIRLDRKNVCETAKCVCDFINMHEDLISISSF